MNESMIKSVIKHGPIALICFAALVLCINSNLSLPVIIYLFLGVIVYRWWLGDPFEKPNIKPETNENQNKSKSD